MESGNETEEALQPPEAPAPDADPAPKRSRRTAKTSAEGSELEPEPSSPPTAPRARREDGHEIDEYGLPLAGPPRIAALDGRDDPDLPPPDRWGLPSGEPWRSMRIANLGRRDPAQHPEDWS